jgi:hypothetical protein
MCSSPLVSIRSLRVSKIRPAKSGYWSVTEGYESGDYSGALKEIEPLAKPDCPEALHLLGVMYGKGQGVTQDLVRAYALLLVAYGAGMTPVGGSGAVMPALGDDPNELEIVQFGAKLTPTQLSRAEELAFRLAPGHSADIAATIKELQLPRAR